MEGREVDLGGNYEESWLILFNARTKEFLNSEPILCLIVRYQEIIKKNNSLKMKPLAEQYDYLLSVVVEQ